MFATDDASLRRLVADHPTILFVIESGNSNQMAALLGATPQNIEASDLVVVGAAGLSGNPTSSTTFGPSVDLYAQGEAVRVRWPGGTTARMSGTSLAAPLVAGAAAAMLAVHPALTAAELATGLKATATPAPTSAGGEMKLLHAAAAAD